MTATTSGPHEELAKALEDAAQALRAVAPSGKTKAAEAEANFAAWSTPGRLPAHGIRGGGGSGESYDDEEKLRQLEAQAARYDAEWAVLKARALKDGRRIVALVDEGAMRPRPKAAPSNLQGCELCTAAGLKRDGQPIPFEHTSNVAERLHRDMRLCDDHYQTIYYYAVPARMGKGWTPTPEETRHWWATGKWKPKVTA